MEISLQHRILLTFFMLWLSHFISVENQELIGYVGIFVFGLLHGANDLALVETMEVRKKRKQRTWNLIHYLIGVFLGMLVFYLIPSLGLFVFIIVSGFHFGNQHWNLENHSKKSLLILLFESLYGLLLLFILFTTHLKEVTQIVEMITQISLGYFNVGAITLSIGILVFLLGGILAYRNADFRKKITLNIFYLLVFSIIFYYAGLIWGFSMYFVLWHSIPSIEDQIQFLYQEKSKANWKRYIKSSFMYWGLASIGVLIAYFGIANATLFKAVFFSLIAAITFPHTLIIAGMQNSIHKKSRT